MNETPLVKNPELGSDRPLPQRGQTPFDAPRPSRVKTFFKWAGLTCVIGAGAAFGYFKFTKHGQETWKTGTQIVPAVYQAKTHPELIFDHADNSDIVNILLIGRDVNWKIGKVFDPRTKTYRSMQVVDKNTPARADSMIVMSLDRTRHEIHMLSLPRDAWVHMPPNSYHVHEAKLNAAHAYGGPRMQMQAIEDDLGLKIHHYAVIKFEGFKNLIDEVGGIDVDVIGALKRGGTRGDLNYDDHWGNLHIHMKPGKQVLDGQQAHNYVRFRMDLEGDPGRIKRQQQVMRALAHKLAHQPWYQIAPIIQEIQRQFETDMKPDDIASAAQFAQSLGDPSKMQPVTMFGEYTTRGKLFLNKSKNQKLLKYLFGSTFNESKFLENSPSTEGDEMGEENNSSPGAKAILRRAGILKGAPGEAAPSEVSTPDASTPPPASTRESRVLDSPPSTPLPSATPDEPRPRRHHARGETRDATKPSDVSTPREATHHHVDLSVPEDERRDSSDSSSSDSSDGSPVPAPEKESTPARHESGEGPVPHAG